MSAARESSTTPGLRILGDCPVPVWGLSSAERLRRQLKNAGLQPDTGLRGSTVLIRADYVYDQRIIGKLVAARNTLVGVTESGTYVPVAAHVDDAHADAVERVLLGDSHAADSLALEKVTPEALSGAYIGELLKTEPLLLLPLRIESRREIEERLFAGSYKGVTDLVTKYVWPIPARWATHLCANTGIRPNHVTVVGFSCVVLATALFAFGWFGVGLVLGWFMTFFDTVDGKLARVTIDSSRFGHFLDKIVDIVHPPFWYAAWGVGLHFSSSPLPPDYVHHLFIAMVVGYILGRFAELAFSSLVAGFSMFTWQPFDSSFRLIMARRNPCLVALTLGLLAGQPDWGLIVVVAWTVLSTAILWVRVFQGVYHRITSGPLHPWLNSSGRADPSPEPSGVRAGSGRTTIA